MNLSTLIAGQSYTVRVDSFNENGVTPGRSLHLEKRNKRLSKKPVLSFAAGKGFLPVTEPLPSPGYRQPAYRGRERVIPVFPAVWGVCSGGQGPPKPLPGAGKQGCHTWLPSGSSRGRETFSGEALSAASRVSWEERRKKANAPRDPVSQGQPLEPPRAGSPRRTGRRGPDRAGAALSDSGKRASWRG